MTALGRYSSLFNNRFHLELDEIQVEFFNFIMVELKVTLDSNVIFEDLWYVSTEVGIDVMSSAAIYLSRYVARGSYQQSLVIGLYGLVLDVLGLNASATAGSYREGEIMMMKC